MDMPARAPNSEGAPWMLGHKNNSLVATLLACSVMCGVASIDALVLRFLARRVSYGMRGFEVSLFVIAQAQIRLLHNDPTDPGS